MSSPTPSSPGISRNGPTITAPPSPSSNFTVVNDGSTDDTNKLGAIGDIHYVLKTQKVDDDLIVVAGDNLFSEKLDGFGEFCREKNAPVLALYDVGDLEEIKKYNAITLDGDGRITFFEEKPKNPTSTLTGIALYFYPKTTLPLIKQYIAERQQSGSAGPPDPMAVSAHAGLHVEGAGDLVRHRVEGNAGGGEPDFCEEVGWGIGPRSDSKERLIGEVIGGSETFWYAGKVAVVW